MSQYIERLVREWKKHNGIIIACDFDDTIYPFRFNSPNDMDRYSKTISLLKECVKEGCTVIIFTARNESGYRSIEEYCSDVGLPIAGININLPGLPYGNHRKIYANVYLDDRSGLELSLKDLKTAYHAIIEEKAAMTKNEKPSKPIELVSVVPMSEPPKDSVFRIEPVYRKAVEWPTLDEQIRPKFDHWLSEHVLGRICVIDEANVNDWSKRIKNWDPPIENIVPGDEVFAWDAGGWDALAGRRGFLILRDRERVLVAQLIAMS